MASQNPALALYRSIRIFCRMIKGQPLSCPFQRRYFFLWGIAKIYNVLGGVTKSIIADPPLFVYSPFSQISQIFAFVFVTIYHLREEIFRLLFKQRFKFCAADLFFFQKQLCALMQHITVFQNQCLCLCITLVDNPVDFSVDLPAHQ